MMSILLVVALALSLTACNVSATAFDDPETAPAGSPGFEGALAIEREIEELRVQTEILEIESAIAELSYTPVGQETAGDEKEDIAELEEYIPAVAESATQSENTRTQTTLPSNNTSPANNAQMAAPVATQQTQPPLAATPVQQPTTPASGATQGMETPPPASQQTTQAPAATSTRVDTDAFAREVVRLVNVERERAGIAPVELSPLGMQAAQLRANELTRLNSHTRPDGRHWRTAFDDVGLATRGPRGENIATGQATPVDVMRTWMNSTAHRNNILNANYDYMGVGVYQDSNGRLHWVQLFFAGVATDTPTAPPREDQLPPAGQTTGGSNVATTTTIYTLDTQNVTLSAGQSHRFVVDTSNSFRPFTVVWETRSLPSNVEFDDGYVQVNLLYDRPDWERREGHFNVFARIYENGWLVATLQARVNHSSQGAIDTSPVTTRFLPEVEEERFEETLFVEGFDEQEFSGGIS